MNNFGKYITPKEAQESIKVDGKKLPLYYWEKLSKKKVSKCIACETEDEWKLMGTSLCFSCTTGEWDASEDSELA